MDLLEPKIVKVKGPVKAPKEPKGGRPKKLMTPRHHPTYLKFLALFGLSGWDDKQEWTLAHISNTKAVDKYFEMKDELLSLSFPRQAVKKLGIITRLAFIDRDLITMLSQFGRLFGYVVRSQNKCIKPSARNLIKKPINYQIYHLGKDTTKPGLLDGFPMQVLPGDHKIIQQDAVIDIIENISLEELEKTSTEILQSLQGDEPHQSFEEDDVDDEINVTVNVNIDDNTEPTPIEEPETNVAIDIPITSKFLTSRRKPLYCE